MGAQQKRGSRPFGLQSFDLLPLVRRQTEQSANNLVDLCLGDFNLPVNHRRGVVALGAATPHLSPDNRIVASTSLSWLPRWTLSFRSGAGIGSRSMYWRLNAK